MPFNNLGIYRFGLLIAALDIFDIYDLAESTDWAKYLYAAIVIGFMATYFLRWKRVDVTLGPLVFLLFFVVTGLAFATRFFIFDDRDSYISAFISPLIFSLAIFIPRNTLVLDAGKILKDLAILFAAGVAFYLIGGFVKPLDVVSVGTGSAVQLLKSLNCVLALCFCILADKKGLAVIVAVMAIIALELRPASTFVLGLICCVPIAIALRSRLKGPRPVPVLIGRALAMTTWAFVVSVPLLLYFYFDDVSSLITSAESYLKSDVIGGQSNMQFRLAILKMAFVGFDNTSFWYGSALGGKLTVPLGQNQTWQWWFNQDSAGEATIHSDFVLVLTLMGILGYIVFSGTFYSILRVRFQELGRRSLLGSGVVIQSIAIIAAVALLIYCSDQPYLRYYSHTHVVWMLLLISEVARKSKVVG
jgi:hypothetical protein